MIFAWISLPYRTVSPELKSYALGVLFLLLRLLGEWNSCLLLLPSAPPEKQGLLMRDGSGWWTQIWSSWRLKQPSSPECPPNVLCYVTSGSFLQWLVLPLGARSVEINTVWIGCQLIHLNSLNPFWIFWICIDWTLNQPTYCILTTHYTIEN